MTTATTATTTIAKRTTMRVSFGASSFSWLVVVVAATCLVSVSHAQSSSSSTSSSPCTMCRDGSPITRPERTVNLPEPYAFIQNCAMLAELVPHIVPNADDSWQCQAIHNVSTYCGCPITALERACQLCPADRPVLENDNQEVLLVEENSSSFAPPIPTDMVTPTCGIVQAYLHSLEETDDECTRIKESLQNDCVCGTTMANQNDTTVPLDDTVQEPTTIPNDDNDNACGICPDGSNIQFPEKKIGYLLTGFPDNGSNQPNFPPFLRDPAVVDGLTCGAVQAVVHYQLRQTEEQCLSIQNFMAGLCGCPTTSLGYESCDFCGTQELPDPNRLVYTWQLFGFPAATCQDAQAFLTHVDKEDLFCADSKGWANLCGCTAGYRQSFRDDLSWLSRLAGTISMLGSCYILYDVWKQYRQGTFTVFNQLIAAVSVCDFVFSLGFALATLPIPEYNEFGEENGIYRANGTEATCKMQGFMIQFGLTGVLYQISLSTYYRLVICYGWTEHRVAKISRYLHIPFLIGLLLALVAIPLYENCYWVCYVPPPPIGENSQNTIIFAHVPIALAVVVTSINMITVYCKVRRQFAAGNRWRVSRRLLRGTLSFRRQPQNHRDQERSPCQEWRQGCWQCWRSLRERSHRRQASSPNPARQAPNTRVSMERELFWQCALYLGAFYVSYTFLLLSQLPKFRYTKPLWVFIMIFAPLQGFWNFCTYTRPRVVRAYRAWRVRNWQHQSRPTSDNPKHQSSSATDPSASNGAPCDNNNNNDCIQMQQQQQVVPPSLRQTNAAETPNDTQVDAGENINASSRLSSDLEAPDVDSREISQTSRQEAKIANREASNLLQQRKQDDDDSSLAEFESTRSLRHANDGDDRRTGSLPPERLLVERQPSMNKEAQEEFGSAPLVTMEDKEESYFTAVCEPTTEIALGGKLVSSFKNDSSKNGEEAATAMRFFL